MFTFVLHSSREFDKNRMSCVHHYNIKQSRFTALKSPVVGCRFSKYTLDQAEEVPFIIFFEDFYHKWVWNFVKYIFYIY